MSSKLGRPSGRPRRRASLLGHPGTFAGEGWACFPSSPGPPPPRTALGCGGLLTLTLRGKAMDGLEEQQERNRPQLSPPSLENRRTDAGFPQRQQAGGAPSRGVRSVSLFPNDGTNNNRQNQMLATQSTRPLNRGRSNPIASGLPSLLTTTPHWRRSASMQTSRCM